ncbi:hypothetical protein HPB47_020035 [Ixodes persulcatus]|uniref:Uncharacterized protein n=1 Tax=Ixodes persulcatus TaxID=34615 RepID=A0AC60QGH0_IXOPE|nr:hypothetical protein HPB47_020035 [Ixodes persulcatus]
MDQAAWCLLIGAIWTLLDRGSPVPLPNCGETLERNRTTSQPLDVEENEDRPLENVIHDFPKPVEWDYGYNLQQIGSDDHGLSRGIIIAIAVGMGVAFIFVVALAVYCCRSLFRKKLTTDAHQVPQTLPMTGGQTTDPALQETYLQHRHWPPEGYKDPCETNDANEFVNPLAAMEPAAPPHTENGMNRY